MTKLVEGTGSGPNGVLVGSVRFGMSGIDDTILTIAFNLFILPLVAAGYLAQLVKDLHQYLKARDDSAH